VKIFCERLQISYGTELSNIEMVKGKLYDKLLKKETLLIDGPYKWLFKDKYEFISLHLYELMLKCKRRSKSVPPGGTKMYHPLTI